MGHSSIAVTLDVYGDSWNLEDHEAAERPGAVLDDADLAARWHRRGFDALLPTFDSQKLSRYKTFASRRP
jgi:hypothetical protein